MASDGSRSEPREVRAVARWEGGLTVGLILGGVAGVLLGLLIGTLAFSRDAATFAAALGGGIFGSVVGAFIGGMSRLEDPPPGREPAVREQPIDRPGLTHDEREG
jgi:hypothetical protein